MVGWLGIMRWVGRQIEGQIGWEMGDVHIRSEIHTPTQRGRDRDHVLREGEIETPVHTYAHLHTHTIVQVQLAPTIKMHIRTHTRARTHTQAQALLVQTIKGELAEGVKSMHERLAVVNQFAER